MKHLKRICILSLLIILITCRKGDGIQKILPCMPISLGNSVIAFYPFSNGSINDFSGNNQNLMNFTSASPTHDRNGNANCAYEFDNSPTSGEFLITTNTAFLNNLNKFSISLWYQPKDTSRDGGDFQNLINRDSARYQCNSARWSIGLYDCRKAVFSRTNSVWDKNVVITNFSCQKEIIARTDRWHHLVATFDQNGIYMKLYRNGTLQEFSIGHGKCFSGRPIYQDIGDLFLGKDYAGKIDDVIIFNKVLSQQEVFALFSLDSCCK